MINLYVMRDTVSGNTGPIFQAENDACMRRECIHSMASVPEYIARDSVVLKIGTMEFVVDNTPIVRACSPVVVLTGTSPEVSAARSQLMALAKTYAERAGDSCEA